MSAAIRIHGLVNRFGAHLVHDGLDMEVPEGAIFGLVGGSGTGKSVLMRSIIGLQPPTAGVIELGGVPAKAATSREARRQQGMKWGVMYQSGALFSALTVVENILFPMREYLDVPSVILHELAMLRLRMVGLPDHAASKFPAELSGGMVKRAALARALALDPPLLFLDEPTAGLDPIAAASFDELVLTLRQQLGLTVVLITHDLDTLFTICDEVGVLVDRKLTQGNLATITRHPHPWIQEYFGGVRAKRFVEEGR